MSHTQVGPALLLALLALGTPALAESGLRLSWDHCAADGRVANKAFACDTNTGSERLVLSFNPPMDVPNAEVLEVTLHIKASDDVMPAWWQLSPSNACRGSAFGYDISAAAAGSCAYPLGPSAVGIVGAYMADFTGLGPGSWRLRGFVLVPADQAFAVTQGTEYFAFAFVLQHTKTVGTGSCVGCTKPMCIGFGSLWIYAHESSPELTVDVAPIAGGGEETVTWQGATVTGYASTRVPELVENSEIARMGCDPDAGTPNRRSTWGALKSLYR